MPKDLFEACVAAGIKKVVLQFEGGNDEGYLDVNIQGDCEDYELEGRIEEWADGAYSYSGAGDGTAYGDNVTYDLVEMKTSHQEWYHVVQHNDPEHTNLEIGE